MATDDRELVYATQYNGYTENEIALPDKYVKFANLGWWGNIPDTIEPYYKNPPYTANVYYEPTNKAVLDVLVREVGPWNEDDNYWDTADDANPDESLRIWHWVNRRLKRLISEDTMAGKTNLAER